MDAARGAEAGEAGLESGGRASCETARVVGGPELRTSISLRRVSADPGIFIYRLSVSRGEKSHLKKWSRGAGRELFVSGVLHP